MSVNQYRLMLIPLFATLIMAGFVTTVGLLTEPASERYGVTITDIASQFTWFTGGVFIGGILAFFVFDYFAIKPVILWSYLVSIALIAWLHITSTYALLPVLLTLIGILLAIVICGGVTVITQQWVGKQRQMVMVGQDAMFNGGGIFFSGAATWFVVNQFEWTSVYLVVAALIGIVVLLSAVSSFEPVVAQEEEVDTVGAWNAGILLVGFSLLLFMMAKISIFVWAPQYIQQSFGVGPEVGGQFMANVFTAAFIGSLLGTWAASRIDVKYLLYGFVVISMLSVFALSVTKSTTMVLLLAYGYGLSVSATYNSYVAFGLSFVESPSHKNVVYLQLMSGFGSTLAPFVSSMIVDMKGDIGSAMQFCFVTLLIVAISLFVCHLLHMRVPHLSAIESQSG
ncbi:MAG: MFS transporter [Pseudomonadales bacterium]|nr:MFS transporter [Pseudomonadales bacterium]